MVLVKIINYMALLSLNLIPASSHSEALFLNQQTSTLPSLSSRFPFEALKVVWRLDSKSHCLYKDSKLRREGKET
jgi:hypothetical protein